MAIGIFMWGWMYNGQFGMISGVLQRMGVVDGPVAFLAYGSTAFWATIFTDVWIGVPMVTLYMLAAMQAIPQDLYEAAWTDGAGRFYRFRRITLPLILPAMITMSMLSLIATFNSFDIIWILTRGGPSGETTTMIIDTYHTAIGSKKYGEGACPMSYDKTALINRYRWYELVGIYAGIAVFLTFVLAPFVEGFLVSLKPLSQLFSSPYRFWPENGSFAAYITMWDSVPGFARYIFNSFLISTIATLVVLLP
eukprot:gene37178-42108_t